MKTTLKKYLYFNASDPRQNEIFHILDKARYFQTRLIIRLLSDFFVKQGIDRNTPASRIKLIIQLYLESGEPAISSVVQGNLSSQDTIAAMIRLLMSQDTATGNHALSPISGRTPIPSEPVSPENGRLRNESPKENSSTIFTDTASETNRLRKMAQGFLTMVDE